MDLVNSIPFSLLFVEEIELSLYHESIKDSSILGNSYNPETQTSNLSVYTAAANTTTDITTTTGSALLFAVDDTKIHDT